MLSHENAVNLTWGEMGIFGNFLVRVENVSDGAVFHPQQKILASSTQSDIKKKTLITVRLTISNRLSIELEHYLKFPGKSHHRFLKHFSPLLSHKIFRYLYNVC